jgi:transposase
MAQLPPHVAQVTTGITIGVDTHKDVHVAAARDHLGRRLATTHIPTTPAGYAELLAWAGALGEIRAWASRAPAATAPAWPAFWPRTTSRSSRSTGPTGRPAGGVARATRSTPTPRPRGPSRRGDRQPQGRRRAGGDAAGAAGRPPDRGLGLHPGHQRPQGARGHRPAELRQALARLPTRRLVAATATLTPGPGKLTTPTAATSLALRSLVGRYQHWTLRSPCCPSSSTPSPPPTAPRLRTLLGVGPDSAALLIATTSSTGPRSRNNHPDRQHGQYLTQTRSPDVTTRPTNGGSRLNGTAALAPFQ